MAASATNTLLALLLALRNLDAPLSSDEQTALKKIGQKLALRPKKSEAIAQSLPSVIQEMASLNAIYQQILTQLEACDRQIPPELFPTKPELIQQLPDDDTREIRGHKPGKNPQTESNELINLTVIAVLTDNQPQTTAQNLNFLDRFNDFLQQLPNEDNPAIWPI